MNKDEILAKSRRENKDEGMENIENKGRKAGITALSINFCLCDCDQSDIWPWKFSRLLCSVSNVLGIFINGCFSEISIHTQRNVSGYNNCRRYCFDSFTLKLRCRNDRVTL